MSDNNSNSKNQTQEQLFADTNISMKSGRLVKDAEIIAGGNYVRFRIATNKQYETDGEVKSLVNFFNILVSKNLEQAFNEAKELKKGDWAYIKGEDTSKSVDTPEGFKETAVTTFAWKVVKKNNPAEHHTNQDEDSTLEEPSLG